MSVQQQVCVFFYNSLQESLAAKAFCVLIFHVLSCALSLCVCVLYPACFRMPISDQKKDLYYGCNVGNRSLTPPLSASCQFLRGPSSSVYRNKYLGRLFSRSEQFQLVGNNPNGTIISVNSSSKNTHYRKLTPSCHIHELGDLLS